METMTEKQVEACERFQGDTSKPCTRCGHEAKAHIPHSERQAWSQVQGIVEMVAKLTREGAAKLFVAEMSEADLLALIRSEDSPENSLAGEESPDLDEAREIVAGWIEAEEISDPKGWDWDEEAALDEILEHALEVQVRGGWVNPGTDMGPPEEFFILLCTGGPAVRIIGELTNGEPSRAWVEHQDWGTPWQQLFGLDDEQQEAILTYCQQYIVS